MMVTNLLSLIISPSKKGLEFESLLFVIGPTQPVPAINVILNIVNKCSKIIEVAVARQAVLIQQPAKERSSFHWGKP